MTVSQTSLVLMTLAVLRSAGQVICRKSHNCDVSDFSTIRLQFWGLGTKTIEVKCASRHTMSGVRAVNVVYLGGQAPS